METAHRFDPHQDPWNIHQNLLSFEKLTIKRQVKTNPLQNLNEVQNDLCLPRLGVFGRQPSVKIANTKTGQTSTHEYEHTHNTDKDCDPCTWQPRPPVRVDAPRKTIPKFSSRLKYGHESQLGARGQDGLAD
jgi:hypothetical protein